MRGMIGMMGSKSGWWSSWYKSNLLWSIYGLDESYVLNNLQSVCVRYWILGCNRSPAMEKNYLFWIYCIELIWHDGYFLNVVFYFPFFSVAMSMRSVLNLFMIYWCWCNELMMRSIPILSQFWWMMTKVGLWMVLLW